MGMNLLWDFQGNRKSARQKMSTHNWQFLSKVNLSTELFAIDTLRQRIDRAIVQLWRHRNGTSIFDVTTRGTCLRKQERTKTRDFFWAFQGVFPLGGFGGPEKDQGVISVSGGNHFFAFPLAFFAVLGLLAGFAALAFAFAFVALFFALGFFGFATFFFLFGFFAFFFLSRPNLNLPARPLPLICLNSPSSTARLM